MRISHVSLPAPWGVCRGGVCAHLGAGAAAMAAVRGSSCAGMGLAPCPPWLRQRDGQEVSRSPLVATGDTSSPKAHPGARCQSTQPSFPAMGFVAWHLHAAFRAPATAVGLLISLTLLPPPPLQQRCGRAIPRLSCLHQRLAQTQLPSPTAPTPRQGAAAAAEPHTWLPCRNLAGLYPLAGAKIAPLCKLRALAAAVLQVQTREQTPSPGPSQPPSSGLSLPPRQDLGKEQNRPQSSAASAEHLSLFQGEVSSALCPAASHPSLHRQLIREKGQHRSKSHEASLRLGVVLGTLVQWVQPASPDNSDEARFLQEHQHPSVTPPSITPESNSKAPTPALPASCAGLCVYISYLHLQIHWGLGGK